VRANAHSLAFALTLRAQESTRAPPRASTPNVSRAARPHVESAARGKVVGQFENRPVVVTLVIVAVLVWMLQLRPFDLG